MDFEVIAASEAWIDLATIWSIARVVIGLGFVVFVHELGHFLVAKMCGVKCEKFYVGFDFFDIRIGDIVLLPRALVKFQWGETEYGVGVIPLGGYVKMLGQDDNPGNMEAENQRSQVRKPGDPEVTQIDPLDRENLDPRSYQAKSVLQRMAIISAGVIFNLIFAVFLAAIAFRSGINYQPAVASSPIAGSPAWRANMDGATILRIGEKRFDSGYAPFMDVAQEVALHASEEPLEVEFLAPGETTPRTARVVPEKQLRRGLNFGTLGINPEQDSRLAPTDPAMIGQASTRAEPPFEPNDEIIALNGNPVSRLIDLKMGLAAVVDQEVTFTVKRKGEKSKSSETASPAESTVDIRVPPNPMHLLGFDLEFGPVVAIRDGSPAEQAGIKLGDQLLSIDGQPLGNLPTLDQRLIKKIQEGQNAFEVEIERGNGDSAQRQTLSIAARIPEASGMLDYGPFAIETMGLAMHLLPVVANVDAGGPAAEVGLKKGDRITSVDIILPEELKSNPLFQNIQPSVVISDATTRIAELLGVAQQLPAGTRYRFSLERDGSNNASVEIASLASDRYFQAIRGIQLTPLEDVYTSSSWSEALQLGARQVRDDLLRIGKFLGNLVTGRMPATMIGGIGTIGAVATMEANEGTSRLLLFLTMLSANLAIINLLPIPVLDGGHLMFLAYEGIMRRPVTEKVQVALSYLGLFFILGLMMFAIVMDISRFVEWFG